MVGRCEQLLCPRPILSNATCPSNFKPGWPAPHAVDGRPILCWHRWHLCVLRVSVGCALLRAAAARGGHGRRRAAAAALAPPVAAARIQRLPAQGRCGIPAAGAGNWALPCTLGFYGQSSNYILSSLPCSLPCACKRLAVQACQRDCSAPYPATCRRWKPACALNRLRCMCR